MGEKIGADEKLRQHLPFVVAGHNYGRLDTHSDQELGTVATSLAIIIEEAVDTLFGIGIERQNRIEDDSEDVS